MQFSLFNTIFLYIPWYPLAPEDTFVLFSQFRICPIFVILLFSMLANIPLFHIGFGFPRFLLPDGIQFLFSSLSPLDTPRLSKLDFLNFGTCAFVILLWLTILFFNICRLYYPIWRSNWTTYIKYNFMCKQNHLNHANL